MAISHFAYLTLITEKKLLKTGEKGCFFGHQPVMYFNFPDELKMEKKLLSAFSKEIE